LFYGARAAHLNWVRDQAGESNPLKEIPVVKVNSFAAEGHALNAARMGELTENKRYAVAATLFFVNAPPLR
jgi:hypothetical protein